VVTARRIHLSIAVIATVSAGCAVIAGISTPVDRDDRDDRDAATDPREPVDAWDDGDMGDAAESSEVSPPAQAITVSLGASADSYVASSPDFADTNYGSDKYLTTKTGSPDRDSFLKFDTSSVPSGAVIDSAVLSVHGNLSTSEDASYVSVTGYSVTDNSWTETGITWNTRPPLVTALATTNVERTNSPKWWTWSVTTFVANQRALGITTISFGLQNQTNTVAGCYYNSRNSTSNQPRLTIIYH
jgi:hypothetical protein